MTAAELPGPDSAPSEAGSGRSPRAVFLYMDATRAVLAAVVAFGHAWLLLIRDYQGETGLLAGAGYYLAGFAHQAVVLFFVLSGYWISRSVLGREARGWSWPDYLTDRLARLMIVLIPALALGGLLDWTALTLFHSTTHLGLTDTWVLRQDVPHDLSIPVLLGNLLFLQHLVVPVYGSNGPLWSLAFEFWYYLWFPALWLTLRRRRPSLMLLALLVSLVNPLIAIGFFAWTCGALVQLAARSESRLLPGWTLFPAGLLFLAALLWCRSFDHPFEDPMLAGAFALLLFVALRIRLPVLPGIPLLARFGANASFSLYITHFPVIAFLAGIVITDARLAPDAQGWGVVSAGLALALLVSIVFARLTEAHTETLRQSLHRLLRRRRVLP